MTVTTVTTLAFDNVVEIVSVLSDAFHDYPVMRYVLGPNAPGMGAPYNVRLHRLVQLFVSGRAYRDEPMMGIRDASGALTAAAVMSLPASPNPRPAFIALRESIWAELGAEARARYDAYAAAAQFFATMPPHHHLNMIGVRRTHQRFGLARELLDAVHKLAGDEPQSSGVSLTTERAENRAILRALRVSRRRARAGQWRLRDLGPVRGLRLTPAYHRSDSADCRLVRPGALCRRPLSLDTLAAHHASDHVRVRRCTYTHCHELRQPRAAGDPRRWRTVHRWLRRQRATRRRAAARCDEQVS